MQEPRTAPQLTNPIPLDFSVCFNTPEGGVLIEPSAAQLHWVPFGLLLTILVLSIGLLLLSLLSIHLTLVGIVGWLLRNIILLGVVLGLGVSLYPQWQALRRPVITISPDDELIEIITANATRRIPFPVVVSLRISGDPVQNPLDRVQNLVFERMNVQRRGVGLVLKHGEVVWCGMISGQEAADRARNIRQRLSLCISGNAQ